MKPFSLYKLPMIILCLGGVSFFAPQSRAQADVAPDHFDGTDPWATAAAVKANTPKTQQPSTATMSSPRTNKSAAPALQPVAARTATTPRRTATKKRKPATN